MGAHYADAWVSAVVLAWHDARPAQNGSRRIYGAHWVSDLAQEVGAHRVKWA